MFDVTDKRSSLKQCMYELSVTDIFIAGVEVGGLVTLGMVIESKHLSGDLIGYTVPYLKLNGLNAGKILFRGRSERVEKVSLDVSIISL